VPSLYQDVATEGDALLSDLEMAVGDENQIYLVGHSMGGLVILQGLVNRILAEAADSHPVANVSQVTLYASPLLGSVYANLAFFTLGISRWVRLISGFLPIAQLRDIREGSHLVQELLSKTNKLICRPTADSKLVKRSIPVRACVAKYDPFVKKHSAIGVLDSSLPPIYLDADHNNVKTPDHHNDQRYLAFKEDLQQLLVIPFGNLCRTMLFSNDSHERRMAAARFDLQYAEMVRYCAAACMSREGLTEEELTDVALRILEFGAKGDTTPSKAMTDVVIDFHYAHDARLDR
jgi:hypothetical protein